jgi:hypothetical protein
MRALLFISSIVTLSYGLWEHDWTLIFVALTLAVIWPLIASGVYEDVRQQRLLDELWDDDDLSESA